MSSYGKGDIREPFVEAILYDGAKTLDFRYEDAVITGKKDALDGLPGSYGSAGEVQQLCVTMVDRQYDLKLLLYYYVYEAADVIGRSAKIVNASSGPLPEYSDGDLKALKEHAKEQNIRLTVGYGPAPENNIASSDPQVRKHALAFYTDLFQRMEKIGATLIGGALYSCWPIDYSKPVDKKGDWERGIEGMAKLGKIASECGIEVLGLECLNRFENHVLNTATERGFPFVKSGCAPLAEYNIYLFTIVLYCDSVKLTEKFLIPAARRFPNKAHRFSLRQRLLPLLRWIRHSWFRRSQAFLYHSDCLRKCRFHPGQCQDILVKTE